jgi:hypothetical protein
MLFEELFFFALGAILPDQELPYYELGDLQP